MENKINYEAYDREQLEFLENMFLKHFIPNVNGISREKLLENITMWNQQYDNIFDRWTIQTYKQLKEYAKKREEQEKLEETLSKFDFDWDEPPIVQSDEE